MILLSKLLSVRKPRFNSGKSVLVLGFMGVPVLGSIIRTVELALRGILRTINDKVTKYCQSVPTCFVAHFRNTRYDETDHS